MRLSNPEALSAHTVAGDVTSDVRAPLAFAARPHGVGHSLNFTAVGSEPDRGSCAKLVAAVISDTSLWAHPQPPKCERRQLPARRTAVNHLNAAKPALPDRADTITLVAGVTEPRCGSGSATLRDEMLPAKRCRDLDDCHTCVPTCDLLCLRDQDPASPQCVHIKAAPVTFSIDKGSPSGPL